jgi:Zn-dependent metalloprotease
MKRIYRKNSSRVLLYIFLLFFSHDTLAQTQVKPVCNMPVTYRAELEAWFYPPQTPGWFEFKPGLVKDCVNFLQQHKAAFGFRAGDSFKLTQREQDKMGGWHYHFQQYFKGIKISGAEILIHSKNGYATHLNGKWVTGMEYNMTNRTTEEEALKAAKIFFPQTLYYENAQLMTKVQSKLYKPKGELIFVKKTTNDMFSPENFRLCFQFLMRPEYGQVSYVVIDALDKSLFKIQPAENGQCNTGITEPTNFYGFKDLNTHYYAPPYYGFAYYLEDWCTPEMTYIVDFGNSTTMWVRIFDTDNKFWNQNPNTVSPITSQWACKRTYACFNTAFGRIGYANQPSTMAIYQNWNFGTAEVPDYSNASMDAEPGSLFAIMRIGGNGTSTGLDDFNTLDIVAHEYAHAITKHESNLEYQGESGAINESFSDIFGSFVEWWDGGSTFDWLFGEDRGGSIRSMSNPNSSNCPDTYGGTFWRPTGSKDPDRGGVHFNSGVMNFWFYLLTTGGSGVNDFNINYFVNGMGIEAAALIAYNANCYYMSSQFTYVDARMATLLAAKNLYGDCSPAHIAVGDAWHAVGVGGYYPNPNNVCGSEVSNPWVLDARDHMNFSAGCTFTVTNTTSVASRYTSSKGMTMYPGFTASTGTNAAFWIAPCNITQNLQPIVQDQQENYTRTAQIEKKKEQSLYNILSAAPNPFERSTILSISRPADTSPAALQIFNSQGQIMRVYTLSPGQQSVQLDGSRWPAGVYYCKLLADNIVQATKAIIKQ